MGQYPFPYRGAGCWKEVDVLIDYRVLLTETEYKRLLDDGYSPEVVEWRAQEKFKQLQEEFLWKNSILKRFYTATPFYEFVNDVFPDLEKLMVITGETTYREMDLDELMEYQSDRADVYVTPASFIHGCYSASTCKDIYALVVDLDRINPETLKAIIDNGNLGMRTPMPTYIVNSGSGVHFYYVFQEPIPHYYRNQPILKNMYRNLCGITQKNILAKTDWHSITQPFRMPGTLTKLGQIVTAWECGEKWKPEVLAKRVGVNDEELELKRRPLLSQQEYNEKKATWESGTEDEKPKKKSKKRKTWVSSLEGNTGFYVSCLQRCYEKTPEGTRYRSMMALTVVARKCGYPKEQLEDDLLQLLDYYNQIGKRMNQSEVKKALRMYNEKALQTRSITLESWFGWDFPRIKDKIKGTQNRPAMSRAEILEEARAIRDIRMRRQGRKWDENNGRKSKEQEIKEWRFEHPEGTPKECMKDTGISKNTVYKWWK